LRAATEITPWTLSDCRFLILLASSVCIAVATPRGHGELEEILRQKINESGFGRFVIEDAAELLAGSQDLASARSGPPRIGCREVEEFQRAVQCIVESIRPSLRVRSKRALDLAPDIAELFSEPHCVPAPCREGWMNL
jgi:hypothetical protein